MKLIVRNCFSIKKKVNGGSKGLRDCSVLGYSERNGNREMFKISTNGDHKRPLKSDSMTGSTML